MPRAAGQKNLLDLTRESGNVRRALRSNRGLNHELKITYQHIASEQSLAAVGWRNKERIIHAHAVHMLGPHRNIIAKRQVERIEQLRQQTSRANTLPSMQPKTRPRSASNSTTITGSTLATATSNDTASSHYQQNKGHQLNGNSNLKLHRSTTSMRRSNTSLERDSARSTGSSNDGSGVFGRRQHSKQRNNNNAHQQHARKQSRSPPPADRRFTASPKTSHTPFGRGNNWHHQLRQNRPQTTHGSVAVLEEKLDKFHLKLIEDRSDQQFVEPEDIEAGEETMPDNARLSRLRNSLMSSVYSARLRTSARRKRKEAQGSGPTWGDLAAAMQFSARPPPVVRSSTTMILTTSPDGTSKKWPQAALSRMSTTH